VPGILAIVGRPNVGKSALFNRIAGRRIAIVHDQPGVTRDRITAEAEFRGHPFTLVDTGGIGLRRGEKGADVITQAALDQAHLAIDAAHAIIFVVNVQEGLVPLDQEVAARLRQAGKPVLLAVNKSDNERVAENSVDFSSLGFDRTYPVSAIHGRGVDELIHAAINVLPRSVAVPGPVRVLPASPEESTAEGLEPVEETPIEDEAEPGVYVSRRKRVAPPPRDFDSDPLRLAIVGRPNVGKSSIINALTQSTRVVVSPIPGTTRDAVDVPFEVETEGRRERFVLVDTAGVRKRKSIDNSIEFYSVKRTEEAIARSDITVLVLDASDGILEQDKKIGALITEARRACIVVVNKWDLFSEKVREAREAEILRRETRSKGREQQQTTTLGEFGEWVQEKLFFLDYAPVIFTSAQSGFHLDRLLEAVRYVGDQLRQEIPTALLNRTLRDAVTRRQPVSKSGVVLKFYYATQIGKAPPKFVLFLNRADLFNRAYEKYLGDQLRKAFGFEGCPLVLIPRARPKTIEPVRKTKPTGPARKRSTARRPRAGSSASKKPDTLRPSRPEQATRPERPARPERAARPDRPARPDRAARPDRPARPGRPARPSGGRPGSSGRSRRPRR
jgi:GTP-binding protein